MQVRLELLESPAHRGDALGVEAEPVHAADVACVLDLDAAIHHHRHATVLRDWKQMALKGLPDVFERRDSLTDVKATYERQLEDLYAEIGRLTTHVNFLKKKLPS